jgi:outer membrane protein
MNSKIFLAAMFLLSVSSTSFAQTQKGSFVLSGKTGLNILFSKVTTGIDSVSTGKSTSNDYDFALGIGYFVADNISIAVSGAYSYNYSKIEQGYLTSGTQNITQSLSIVPQVQYYFPVYGKLRPSAAVGAGFSWLRQRDSRVSGNYNKVYELSGVPFYGGLGVSYFVSRAVSFDLGVQYSYTKFKDKLGSEQVQKQSQFAGTMGVSVFF